MDKPPEGAGSSQDPGERGAGEFPEAIASPPSRWHLQLVWLVPLVAVLIGGWLAVQAILQQGPTITITFKTGEGLEAGKTKIKFKNVDIGVVKSVVLSKDHASVIASAELAKDAASLLVTDTRFWVVRPRISGGTVSGLDTLLSGSFIGMDVGTQSTSQRHFTGLEAPPVVASSVPGREFVLKSEDIGSLDVGTPVYFRRLQVGQVTAYDLDADGAGVTMRVFIDAPYDKFVKKDTRFWQASGVDLSLDANGMKIDTQSLVAILVGGLAFQTPPETAGSAPAAANTVYELFSSRADAMKRHDRIVSTYVLNFTDASVRGLAVGAPVEFRGIVIGEVSAIYTHFDREKKEFSIPVEIHLYPERFTERYQKGEKGGRITMQPHELARLLVERGLRGQLRTGNLLTGATYVTLDFFPAAPKAAVNWNVDPPVLPTVPGSLQSLQDSLAGLVAKLNRVPIEGIGKDVRQTLQAADALVKTLDSGVAPEARSTLAAARAALDSANGALQPDSELLQGSADTMREVARAAASMRVLADYLERHPEALLRGKAEDRQ